MKRNEACWFVLFIVVLLCSPSSQWQQGVAGNFGISPQDGYQCSYKECRNPGPGPRLFQVRCENGVNNYGCIYRGNPHGCGNVYNGNAQNYYAALATKSANGRPNGCSYGQLYHDNCQDAVFQKVVPENGYQSPAPQWCAY